MRGNDQFGKNAHDLCLVPNVKNPHMFKVPKFVNYKGISCPLSRMVMYTRKTSPQTDNHQLIIHYFQDSLTGGALKWYMGLDSTQIQIFNDLGEAFVCQYKYNVDMAPDRDDSVLCPENIKKLSRNTRRGGARLLHKLVLYWKKKK